MSNDSPSVKISSDSEDTEPLANLWFELAMERGGGAALYIGADTGSRGVTQTLRLSLSNVYDPLPDLAAFAEHAYLSDLPFAVEIDSEGPGTRLSVRLAADEATAIVEVRELWDPVVYFAAEVNPGQIGVALAHALRTAIENPDNIESWINWYMYYGRKTPVAHDYFGSPWLRELTIDQHPSKDEYFPDIDTWNGTHFPWVSNLKRAEPAVSLEQPD
jgi:hypothetical protein